MKPSSIASGLQPLQGQELAVKVLSKQEPVSHLAKQEQVSRKFLYQQKAIAQKALNNTFEKKEQENELLYYLPITQQWIFQLILALILINYFFLRKHLNSDYLDLLRFFLNHRTFRSSRVPERVGQSPTELMTGQKHPHWLELLGFELFQRA